VLRIKTNSCRGGVIEDIFVKDIQVGQCGESVLKINLDYEHNEVCCRGYYPTVKKVLMENVTCEHSKYGVQVIGLEEGTYVEDITVRYCHFNGVEQGNIIKGKTRNIVYDKLKMNGSLCLQKNPYKHYSEWMTASEMQRTPKSYLLDFSSKPKWSYVMGIELEAILDTYLKYGNPRIWEYCKEYTDTMINAQGEIRGYQLKDYNLDNIRTGHFVARMYQQKPEQKNLIAMREMMKQLRQQPRTEEDGVFWHKAIYSYQVWLDGIFMGLPFYTMAAPILLSAKEAGKVYDDVIQQVKTTYERTFDPQTGLNRHAWDETHEMFWADPQTGLSQHCWGRAQGWYTMALIELLDALPTNYARRQEVVAILQQDLENVVKWQDKESGLWYQVMDAPNREGNYLEATCSSMFAYALLKAYRKGYVANKAFQDAGIRAYRGILQHFIRVNDDETISLTHCCSVAGLGPGLSEKVKRAAPNVKENRRRDGSYNYYLSEPVRDNDAKGAGPFIWASLEMEALDDMDSKMHITN
jgi:rhamnogalacturonyl hydrolase YesR